MDQNNGGEKVGKPNLIKEARQKQLIEATISSIGRHGYAGTTLNHVAGAAGLSPGIVNFYFKSKDQLLAATLAKLADEYESIWMAAIESGRHSPAAALEAMLEADFHATTCTHEKVVVWFAFWSEAQSRPLYKSVVSELEERYHQQTKALFAALIEEGGYADIDADAMAIGINAMVDGMWADYLIAPETFDREYCKAVCRRFLAALFPHHFQYGGAGAPGAAISELANASARPEATAHRQALSAALKRRLAPEGFIAAADLAAKVGIAEGRLAQWLDGSSEPTSSELGRLVAAVDPEFLTELYAPEISAMAQSFENRVARQKAEEERARAALERLRPQRP
jgi:TetR/AcrR family transcriptional repressor of bet genes